MMKSVFKIFAVLAVVGALAGGGFLIYTIINGGSGEKSKDTVAPTLEAEAESNQKVYRIDLNQSEVSFHIEEDLRGVHNVVIGRTKEVAGDILVDFDSPAQS